MSSSTWSLLARLRGWLLALALLPALAQAGSLSIMPTRVDFTAGRSVESLLLTNLSAETVTVETQVIVWPENAAGQQANDVVVTPAVLTLPPYQRLRVRLGLLRRTASDVERAYRVYFTELPAPSSTNAGAIGVRLRVGIPIFVAAEQSKAEPIRWSARSTPEGWRLEASNPGNVHTRIAQARLGKAGSEALVLPSPYVLARSVLSIPLATAPAPGTRVLWTEGSDEREGVVALP